MKTNCPSTARRWSKPSRRRTAGFTMVEIALSLGILAFALVAIVGVLPEGLKVQRQNREETIINQEAAYLVEAMRGGALGMDDLTRHMESITVRFGALGETPGQIVLTNFAGILSEQIIGLLTTPNSTIVNGRPYTNSVVARMRAISGNALDAAATNDTAFRYEVRPMIMPFPGAPSGNNEIDRNIHTNLHEVRLEFRWPAFQRGGGWATGRGRKTYRTLVSGEMQSATNLFVLYRLAPNSFVKAR